MIGTLEPYSRQMAEDLFSVFPDWEHFLSVVSEDGLNFFRVEVPPSPGTKNGPLGVTSLCNGEITVYFDSCHRRSGLAAMGYHRPKTWIISYSKALPGPTLVPLTTRQRSQLFSQLTTLEHAGIAPAQAFSVIGRDLPSNARQALTQIAMMLARGQSIADAGQRSGLLLPWEARLVRAAEHGGRLESLYKRLSEHYASRAQLFGRLKSRLIFPFLMLTLATFVAPFPALFQGTIGLSSYLLRAAGPPLLLYGGLRLLALAYRQQLARETGATWAKLLLAIPVLGGLLARQQQRDGLFGLLLLLESGVPILEALPLAGKSVADPLLRARFAGAAAALADGRSVLAETLNRYGVVDDADATALFASGAAAGRLDEAIRHQIRQWDAQLELQWDTLAEWLPRLFYAAVAIFMAWGIVGGYRGMIVPD